VRVLAPDDLARRVASVAARTAGQYGPGEA